MRGGSGRGRGGVGRVAGGLIPTEKLGLARERSSDQQDEQKSGEEEWRWATPTRHRPLP